MDILGQTVFYRTYSRRDPANKRESFADMTNRVINGLSTYLNSDQLTQVEKYLSQSQVFPAGRFLWVGGTEWLSQPVNYPGAYNCTSLDIINWDSFVSIMDLAMMGCGTGANLLYIDHLPTVTTRLNVSVVTQPKKTSNRQAETTQQLNQVIVGDSRKGWCQALGILLHAASCETVETALEFDLTNVRPKGEKLKGFGGVANPTKLPSLFFRIANIINKAVGRKLTATECCLVLGVIGDVVVSGNIRRSAGMRQASSSDQDFADSKLNLWVNVNGVWTVDPEKDVLRTANHTRVFFHKPSLVECVESVEKQYQTGEGAIQYAPEAIARANADLLWTRGLQKDFLKKYNDGEGAEYLSYLDIRENTPESIFAPTWQQFQKEAYTSYHENEIPHRMGRYSLNPCGEIIGRDFLCNLAEVHLNQFDPLDIDGQKEAFATAGLITASLLHHQFADDRLQSSRAIDPIIAVSFTGLFDFFVKLFGVDWLKWWEAGRVDQWCDKYSSILAVWSKIGNGGACRHQYLSDLYREIEKQYLVHWRRVVSASVEQYCQDHDLKMPNRYTTVQPAGTKSLLTGASPGWHPPKAIRYIRRVTFAKNDPIALAAMDMGYNIVPSQSDKDEKGQLLDNPFDPRCTEWLLEIPTEVSWANMPGVDQINVSKFSALAQFDFYMTVQKYYTTHNTSGTIEVRQQETGTLGRRIYDAIQNDEGYISVALLARFDDYQTFPRLPFEPISKEVYDQLQRDILARRVVADFDEALRQRDRQGMIVDNNGPAGCDSDKCLIS